MEAWGFGIFLVGLLGYFIDSRRPGWLLLIGIGIGLLIGVIWFAVIFTSAFGV